MVSKPHYPTAMVKALVQAAPQFLHGSAAKLFASADILDLGKKLALKSEYAHNMMQVARAWIKKTGLVRATSCTNTR